MHVIKAEIIDNNSFLFDDFWTLFDRVSNYTN